MLHDEHGQKSEYSMARRRDGTRPVEDQRSSCGKKEDLEKRKNAGPLEPCSVEPAES